MRSAHLCVLPLILACASGGGLPPRAIELNTGGVQELAQGHLDDAEARFRLALELHPRFAEPHANLGLVMLRRGNLAAAEDHLRTALQLDPDFDEAWSNLGVVLLERGELDDAAEAFERALSIDPTLLDARRNLADLWIRLRRFGAARAQLMRLVQLTDDGRAEGQLAYCELRLDRPAAARARAERVLAVDPDEPHARLVRGLVHARAGRLDSAVADLLRAERGDTRFDARLRLVAIALQRGRLDEVPERLSWLLTQAPEHAGVRLLAAAYAMARGDAERAWGFARGALHLDAELTPARTIVRWACAHGATGCR